MEKYKIISKITEIGPYVAKIILSMPFPVKSAEISVNSFNIYTEKREEGTDRIVISDNFITHAKKVNKGFVEPWKVYTCDEDGRPANSSQYVAIELREIMDGLYRTTEGDVMSTRV